MRNLFRIVAGLLVAAAAMTAHAEERVFNQAELDSLLAPIALYPDPLLNNVLAASQTPQDVVDAAAWAKANPQLRGDAALQTVEGQAWAPSVKALAATPEVLTRMAESPKWLYDLGEAYSIYGQQLLATVQELRARAQASGYLQSNDQQSVYEDSGAIAVQPVYPHLIYAPYYDPFLAYGPWWWPGYAPVVFSPFVVRPVFVTRIVVGPRFVVAPHRFVATQPRFVNGGARPIVRPASGVTVTPFRAVPESRRQPIVSSHPQFHEPPRNAPHTAMLPPARAFSPPARSYSQAPRAAPMPAPQRMASAPSHFNTTHSFAPTASHGVGHGSAGYGGGHGSGGRGGHR